MGKERIYCVLEEEMGKRTRNRKQWEKDNMRLGTPNEDMFYSET